MDLNHNASYFPCALRHTENFDSFGDTALRLDCFGNKGSISDNCKLGNVQTGFGLFAPPLSTDDGCGLVLGLGPGPSTLSKPSRTNGDSILQLGLCGPTASFLAPTIEFSDSTQNMADEGSTSAKNSGGYIPSLILAPQKDTNRSLIPANDASDHSQLSFEASTNVTISNQARPQATKRCRFAGCTKGARGATGLCIGHGGGQRCQKHGCNKGAESRTAFCKAHGGGSRCEHLGCTKSAEGKTDFCIAHGGGRRCGYPGGCDKAARGRSGLCIKHGGGKRCSVEGCVRSAEGKAGLCISHGGGRRCQAEGCSKGAQGSTRYCKAHGGGKRCVFVGCTKGAEGSTPLCKGHGGGKRCMYDGGGICPKSVHGGTSFCVAHGGGKRCAVEGCTKSARGRTDCCVRHGGGRRCAVEGCEKSAQGSTDFCKAHGGGKRCNWGGEGKCEKFARGRSGLCAAHTTLMNGRQGRKGRGGKGLIRPGLFHGLVGSSSAPSSTTTSVVTSDMTGLEHRPAKRQQLIPPQVLVPLSMKSASSMYSGVTGVGSGSVSGGDGRFEAYGVPEGRVHGGGLMSLLGGNLNNVI